MPEYVSKEGVWVPAKEHVHLENKTDHDIEIDGKILSPGEDMIYDGPDRQALLVLKEAGEDYLGQHFTMDMDMFHLARGQGFKDVKEYAESIGHNSKEAQKIADKTVEKYRAHGSAKPTQGVQPRGGGINTANPGQGDRLGGFGDPPKD